MMLVASNEGGCEQRRWLGAMIFVALVMMIDVQMAYSDSPHDNLSRVTLSVADRIITDCWLTIHSSPCKEMATYIRINSINVNLKPKGEMFLDSQLQKHRIMKFQFKVKSH